MKRWWISALGALLLAGVAMCVMRSDTLPEAVSAERLVPLDQIDHGPWGRLLKKYVDAQGMVDYTAWKRSSDDRAALDRYLAELGRGDPGVKTPKAAVLAFWINAYNALTIQGILQHYPTSSIRNHTARVFGYNIWDDLLLPVGTAKYSLNDIEHKILRKQGEPRMHFTIVCASIGCPPLSNEAYLPETLEAQLSENTRVFFSRSKHFQADHASRTVRVSPILKWFSEDFGPTAQQGLIGLVDYLPGEATRRMITDGKFKVRYLDYDWGLNDQRKHE